MPASLRTESRRGTRELGPGSHRPARSWGGRTPAAVALVFFGCYAGAALALLAQAPGTGASLLFPPYAVLTAALLLAPLRTWWWFVLSAAAGTILGFGGVETLSFAALAEVANAAKALVAAGGVRLLTRKAAPFGTFRDMAVFLLFAALLGPMAGALIGASGVVLHDDAASFWLASRGWLISNMVSGVTLLPLILVVATLPGRRFQSPRTGRLVEAAALAACVLTVALATDESTARAGFLLQHYALLPFLIWAAVRFGPEGTIAVLAALSAMTVIGEVGGVGTATPSSPVASLLELQLFLLGASIPILLLAALIQEHAQATAALRESRAQYRSVVEDQTELICRFLPDGTYTFVNRAYCRYFQTSPEELVGLATFWRFVPESDREAAKQSLASVTPDNPVITYEHRVTAPGGEVRWHQWTDRGFFDESGRVLEFQSVGRDVTDRRSAEEALRENEERLALAVGSAQLGVWDWDLVGGVAAWSGRMLLVHGRDVAPPGPPFEKLIEMVHPHDRARVREALEGCLERRVPLEVEYRVLRPDGSEGWVVANCATSPDGEGRPARMIVVCRDVTARKVVEQERRRLELHMQEQEVRLASEERFRSLADNVPALIWRSGLENEGVYFNKTWLDFTGRSLEQELGFGWVESVHPEDRQPSVEICDASFRRREPLAMQLRLRRRDGEYRWVLDTGTPYLGPGGEFLGYVGTCVDITELRRAEDALQDADRRKDEFLALLGHELRNPLTPISAAVELLRTSASTDESIVWAREVVARQVRQLTQLVDDLLDVSRITRGTIRIEPLPLDLLQVVNDAVEASRPMLDERRHELSIVLRSASVPIRGDLVRLVQVVSNLLNNAAKYTPPGGRIQVIVERVGASAVLRVVDNGAGMRADVLERVFDMFVQIRGPAETEQGGLGMGLTLAKRLVELHGGTIEARSEGPGSGSELVVRLPLATGAGLVARGRPDPVIATPRARQPAARRRILVVDDNVDAAEGLSRVLRVYDHEVHVAHDGLAALTVAERVDPDVVLLDLALPKLDGIEVARRLLRNARGRAPLIVATTGFGQAQDHVRTAEAGFDHHLTKPIDIEVLESLLRSDDARGRSPDSTG
jgi:PAS domain S-box-containing protein